MALYKGYFIGPYSDSTCGKTALAKKRGVTYFVKRFQDPVEPVHDVMDAKTYRLRSAKFSAFKEYKHRLNAALRLAAASEPRIIAPCEESVSPDGHWVEFSPYVSGALDGKELARQFAGLSRSEQLQLLKQIASLYAALHKQHIVHADPKLSNLVFCLARGKLEASVIDFDGAFLDAEPLPDSVIGSIDYFSPELGRFSNMEADERAASSFQLTEKSDIFSLGIIFCELLCGEKPAPSAYPPHLARRRAKGKPIYLWTALVASGGDVTYEAVPPKRITDPALRGLLRLMMANDPSARPSAEAVAAELDRQRTGAPVRLPAGESARWDAARLAEDGFSAVTAANRYGRDGFLLQGVARERFMVTEVLAARGYLRGGTAASSVIIRKAPAASDATWPEDHLRLLPEALSGRCWKVTRAELSGVRGYALDDGVHTRFMPANTLILLGVAAKAPRAS